jgi:hypothetical protein
LKGVRWAIAAHATTLGQPILSIGSELGLEF